MKKRKFKINKIQLIKSISIIAIVVIILILTILNYKATTLKCTRTNDLIEGFTNNEKLTIKFNLNKKIKNLKVSKTITINDFYTEYGTFTNTLEKIYSMAYENLGEKNYTIKKEKTKVVVKATANKKDTGLILNNLAIIQNGPDLANLRMDAETDLKSDTALKIGDKYSKKELKNKLKEIGYICK